MGVYILSVLSKSEFESNIIEDIKKQIQSLYPENRIEHTCWNFQAREHKELDFDIQDIEFNKERIHEEIDKLIKAILIIFENFSIDCDIIGGYNDTESWIVKYEEDREVYFRQFGLFGTRNPIPNYEPYCVRNRVTIYQNFEFDSMGVVF